MDFADTQNVKDVKAIQADAVDDTKSSASCHAGASKLFSTSTSPCKLPVPANVVARILAFVGVGKANSIAKQHGPAYELVPATATIVSATAATRSEFPLDGRLQASSSVAASALPHVSAGVAGVAPLAHEHTSSAASSVAAIGASAAGAGAVASTAWHGAGCHRSRSCSRSRSPREHAATASTLPTTALPPKTLAATESEKASTSTRPTASLAKGDRVWVWSASTQRWFSDGEVLRVGEDGSVTVRYNDAQPSAKLIPAKVVQKYVKRRSRLSAGGGSTVSTGGAACGGNTANACDSHGEKTCVTDPALAVAKAAEAVAAEKAAEKAADAAAAKAAEGALAAALARATATTQVKQELTSNDAQNGLQRTVDGGLGTPTGLSVAALFLQPPPDSQGQEPRAPPRPSNLRKTASKWLLKDPALRPSFVPGAKASTTRRDTTMVAAEADTARTGIFSGCSVLVSHLGGADMSTARRRLLCNRVSEAGGCVAETWSREVTHLVVIAHLSRAALRDAYRGARRGSCFRGVVTDSWLCDSLASNRRLPEDRYLWKCPVKVKVELEPSAPESECLPHTSLPRTRTTFQRRLSFSKGGDSKRRKTGGEGGGSRFAFKEGDWNCPECGAHNFKSRGKCWKRECSGARLGDDNAQVRSAEELAKDEDWSCPVCGSSNFKMREACYRFHCSGRRPEESSNNEFHRLGGDEDRDGGLKLAGNGTRPPGEPGSSHSAASVGATGIGSSLPPDELRERIVEEFRICGEGFAARGDNWRSWQYKKAVQLVMAANDFGAEDLEQLGLTANFIKKCEDIRRQGCLEQATAFRKDEDTAALAELTQIHGVGAKLAQTWLKLGVRSVVDARARADTLPSSAGVGVATGLSHAQRTGLELVEDQKVPTARAEVERLAALVRREAVLLGLGDTVVPCGGYRAGQVLCKGVHLVVAVEGGECDVAGAARRMLAALQDVGIVVADLGRGGVGIGASSRTVPQPETEDVGASGGGTVAGGAPPTAHVMHLVARGIPDTDTERPRFRRLDLVVCAKVSLPFVTMQWTGSDSGLFNRELRRVAAFRGLHLGTTFLCRAERVFIRGMNVGEIARCGKAIRCDDEREVFEALGLPYREPQDRKVDAEMLAEVARAAKQASSCRLAVKAELDRTMLLKTEPLSEAAEPV
eukprot:TRINITY_DN42495_c0_g1_i3.p1 TRINITY_DN42495_c0_g1~~TRINITY_DN42495_c0_g1_i3.p1  ORF type:complete len:1174 (+),score=242.05 TRINITY_DN42495_c0_g1_i3:45-3524(+)